MAVTNKSIFNRNDREDLARRLPVCLAWGTHDVSLWIEYLGFPYYKEAFLVNNINGRRLMLLDASNLPKMGITNFDDIKVITAAVRNLLGIGMTDWNRSIELHRRETLELFLEQKTTTGKTADELNIVDFVIQHKLPL